MVALKKKIQALAEKYTEKIITIRRHLHQYPELSYQEHKTAAYIAQQLNIEALQVKKIAKTGLLVTIQGKNTTKKTIALRADIDALPITEKNAIPYKSQHPGIMHACGHDVHTASLIGSIYILLQLKEEFEGTIKCIFQPGEEQLPGGASIMIKEGILENPTPNLILGQHVDPTLSLGTIGFSKGYAMASGDVITLTIQGKGGHAAIPQKTIDPIVISAHIITALQQLVSRNNDPLNPTVFSIGKIQGGKVENIIPNTVTIKGVLRTADEVWRKEAKIKIIQIAENTAKAFGGYCDVKIEKGYPALYNNLQWTDSMIHAAQNYLDNKNVLVVPMLMTTEDFAYYAQKIPGCFYRIGVHKKSKSQPSQLHTNTFNVDESVLKTSMSIMSWLAIQALNKI